MIALFRFGMEGRSLCRNVISKSVLALLRFEMEGRSLCCIEILQEKCDRSCDV
jgi:hypothetical protein